MNSGPVLEARGVSRHFHGVVAVEGVDLRLERGTIHGLIGPNGAGKTTLFNLLTGLVLPSSGTVLFDGHDITRWSAARRAGRGLGRVFQRTQLFQTLSVREHLRLVDPQHLGGNWIEAFGLGPWLDQKPATLPHGVARKVELCSALAARASVLLLDEPAAGLTEEERQELGRLLRLALEQGRTLLLVEHDLEWVVDLVDRLTVLDFGRVIAEGTPHEVAASPSVRLAYLGEEEAQEA